MSKLSIVTLGVFTALLVGSAGRTDERPRPPFTVVPAPPTAAIPPGVLHRFPMVVVYRDPSLYPIVVTHGRGADYPIRIIGPDGAPVPPGDGSTPPLVITPTPLNPRVPLRLTPLK